VPPLEVKFGEDERRRREEARGRGRRTKRLPWVAHFI
jgi:hypothetical protein